jgi:long-chain acyl-CoA synthetase
MDKDGFLYVLGRFKSLLISDDGEKYSPEGIEEAITERSLFIEQLMLYNDQCKYTSALLAPNAEALKRWARVHHIDLYGPAGPEKVLEKLESELNEYKKGGEFEDLFPSRWLPSAIAVLSEPFSMENHLINSSGKMVRSRIIEYHKERIGFLYTPEAKNFINPANLQAIRDNLS